MIKRAWTYGLATLALCYVACDSGRTAGSSMETENSIALQVQLADGTPAARMDVIVRPDSYLSGVQKLSGHTVQKAADSCNTVTDCENRSGLVLDYCVLIILYLASNDLGYFFWFQFHIILRRLFSFI